MTLSQQAPSLVEPLNELSAWLSEHNIDMQMPVGMIDPAEAAARITELEGDLKAAFREISKLAREAGEAKGRLEMSEAAGIVEGWRERAERAEARCRALESASPAEPSGWRRPSEGDVLQWLRRSYVSHADERQKAMGLSYTTAETEDLARGIARFVATWAPPTSEGGA